MSVETDVAANSNTGNSFAWYRSLTPPGKKSFWAAYFGWCLDAADAQIFTFIIPTLMATWALSSTQIGAVATVTWVTASLGGWVGGILADRFGRVRALQITILCFVSGSLLCSIAQSFEQLFLARALFGFGFGGEWAIGAVLVGEIAPAKHRGLIGGIVQSAFTVGWLLVAMLYPIYYELIPENIAWRALFATGALPALLLFFIRRYVPEPPIFVEESKRGQKKWNAFLEIFSRDHLSVTLTLTLLGLGIQAGTIGLSTWLPTYLRTVRHLSPSQTGTYMMVFLVSTVVGYISGALLADKFGRRASFIICAVAESAMVIIYTNAPVDNFALLFLGVPLGICFGSVYGGVVAALNEMYPTRLRGSGVGFCFNFGRGAGALSGLLVGIYSAQLTLPVSIALFVSLGFSLAIVAAFLLPETKGKLLE